MVRNNRLWVIGSVTVMIVALLAGWFLGAQPFVNAATVADESRIAIDAQNASQRAILAQLAEENENLPELQAEYQGLAKSIPSSAGTSAFITGLDSLAASTGVQVTGITIGQPVAYSVPSSGVVVTPDPAATVDPEATPAPVVPAEPVGSIAVTDPLITPENFVGIAAGVNVTGSYEAMLSFVNGLQTGSRLYLVTGITSTRNADAGASGAVTAEIRGMIYVIRTAG